MPATSAGMTGKLGALGTVLMESQDQNAYRLTAEQVEEVRRRRADRNARMLTLDEFKKRLSGRDAGG
jgi:hypothetical protein